MQSRYAFPLLCALLGLSACGEQPASAPRSEAEAVPPLVAIAERGDLPALDALLANGESPDVADACRWTPLMKAAQNGHVATARRLLEAGADPEASDKGGYTALMFAASRGHAEVTTLLLRYGADPDRREASMGWSALIWAAKEGRTAAVGVLVDHGADVSARGFDGRSAADWAAENRDAEVLALLQGAAVARLTGR
jgi:ankyrin repeat protein